MPDHDGHTIDVGDVTIGADTPPSAAAFTRGEPIDPTNAFLVGAKGDHIIITFPPGRLTRSQALTHAAWLVAIADTDNEFPDYLKAVRST